MISRLFRHIEALQGDRPWGSVLDAGTGTNSIRWLASLATERWTAVSGASAHAEQAAAAVADHIRPQDRIRVGNWRDPDFMADEPHDVVLADYLLGAIDGFAPYFQPDLFRRLRALTRHRLYLIGLEPYVVHRPETEAGRLVWDIGRFRNACLIHAGEMPYREYPMDWVIDHLGRAGFKVRSARHFANRYKARFVNGQIDMLASRLARLPDRRLAEALAAHGEDLRARGLALCEAEDGLRHGHDYVVAADPL